jgi:choline dehydrogenase-like flavoprotein
MAEVIVVGSGASAVNAAVPLVEAGCRVLMLDWGNRDATYEPIIPAGPFSEIRRSDEDQHRYFLGDAFEGIPLGTSRVGAQLTPPRAYISRDAAKVMPVDSGTFFPMESLARGGLASGWGAGAFPFDDEELRDLPISRAELAPHYEAVAERIGISGARDDLIPFLGDSAALMPPLEIDANAEAVLARYQRRRAALNAAGFVLGQTRLAVCTRAHRGRGPHAYTDMDFWADPDRSVYRPRWTLEELEQRGNFRYLDRRRVVSFAEGDGGASVLASHAETGAMETHRADALVLAAGALGTARIVLRSLQRYGERVPVLCNPYTYVPVINLHMIGRESRDRRHSLAQLTAFYRPPSKRRGAVQIQLFSYRSLLTFKLLKESPLPYREGLRVMRALTPLLGILGVNHEDRRTPEKYCALQYAPSGGPDRLAVHYVESDEELRNQSEDEKAVLRSFLRLGCVPLRRIRLPAGSSIHYAGTLPMSESGADLTTGSDGRLAGTRAVYVVDGSVLPYLPAKGLTFTLMANANRVGEKLARTLKAAPRVPASRSRSA